MMNFKRVVGIIGGRNQEARSKQYIDNEISSWHDIDSRLRLGESYNLLPVAIRNAVAVAVE